MKKLLFIATLSCFLSACTFTPNANPTFVKSNTSASPTSSISTNVPLPSGIDAINLFWQLINEKRIPEAIAMMSPTLIPDDSTKQAYGVQFNAFESARVISVEPYGEEAWTNQRQTYKTTLEVAVSATAADAPIPYYGYDGNPSIRFIAVIKDTDGKWKIDEIATGP